MRVASLIAAVALTLGTAQAEEPQLSPAKTVDYLVTEYAAAALVPQLAFHLEYRPPFLHVTWQRDPGFVGVSAVSTSPLVQEQADIDLRYAHFDSWNDGRRDRNIMLIECWHYYPCYNNPVDHISIGHGEIDYPVRAFARDGIASALNHLASVHEKERPKTPFD